MSAGNGSRKVDLHCPFCKQKDVSRTRGKGFLEESVFPLIKLRPYRCRLCRRRFYRFSLENGIKRPKGVRKKKTPTTEQAADAFSPSDEKEFRELIARIRESENRLFGSPDSDSPDQIGPNKD